MNGCRLLLGGGGPSGPQRCGGAAPVQTRMWSGETGPCGAAAAPAERGRLLGSSPARACAPRLAVGPPRGGLTLLEVVLALVILGIGLAAALAATAQAQAAARRSVRLGEAAVLAEGVLAQARSAAEAPVPATGGERHLRWSLAVDASGRPGILCLTVTVLGPDPGAPPLLTLVGLRAERTIPSQPP